MDLQRGLPLLIQQFGALFKKNFLLSWRNKGATFLQLFSSLFFIFLIFCIGKAIRSRFSSSTEYENVFDPKPLVSLPIPPCEDKFYTKLPCFDFVWSGNGSAKIQSIVNRIMTNNPGRPIPSDKVKSFSTRDEVDAWLYSDPMRCPGALHFVETNATVISYGLQTNSTPVSKRGHYEDPTFKFQIPLQIVAEREMARSLIGDPNFNWTARFKEFAHPAIEEFSVVAVVGPTFFLAIAMFGFVIQISSLITEKELKLRQLVTIFGFPYSNNFPNFYRIIWSLFPPNLLAEALSLLADATSTPQDPGISWSKRADCAPNDLDCVITINDIYIWLTATFFLWFLLAIYFDNIIPNSSGVRKSLFYFLKPGYWTGRGGNKVEEGGICSCIGSIPSLEDITPDDEDVLEEENKVKQQRREGVADPNIAVQICGLAKTYPGTTNIGCCKCKKTSPYHALKGLWVNFPKNQLFCLLGPNGAGKTTTINCLTGITPVTEGDALIYGYSIRSSVGMSNIRRIIGVCPQFDILWNSLSGQEHLELFSSIKGLPPSSVKSVAQKSLAEVKLTQAAKMRAGSYSGGMKRRLSVAIALIGDPKLVIMDEPTTGMDPITRRHVWDIIENAKKGRAIVLTTHSMEEADILSDRIGIMAKGRLRCIGTSIRLKSRFGTGFIAHVSFTGSTNGNTRPNDDAVTTPYHEAVKQFFKYHLDIVPKEENKAFLTFVIPHDREARLTKFFGELQDRETEFGIADIQLGLTTLEEVFLNIAKKAELESAAAEGSMESLTLTSGIVVQVPVGARFVGIPGTESAENPRGVMVEVQWEQDDTGSLCISEHSPETPVPPGIPQMPSLRRRSRTVQGVVIDPNQIVSNDDR
ncbi:ABC transporter A family member 2 isoform X4 [Vitis vinifera]|uniref:ABC transporter A family member 2 isoform X4 n=1 Tax=Vitis vinifera TaxID=29760 RepID=UPI0008FEC461|nr:ABC transporter A family member 2 isoform X4 [Vitis vinifera]|eukprot:XP_019082065.1 PREDICTED: ABC transporter A family member 2 isoform X5 [Vitis vinifera]